MTAVGVFCALALHSLGGLGRWGWIAAFVYCACAALRLARFNVNTGVVDKRYFQGLPSPAAAALVAGFIWLLIALGIAIINIHPPIVLFGVFVFYGLSGYGVYAWRKAKGQHSSVISTSTDEPDERGLHK